MDVEEEQVSQDQVQRKLPRWEQGLQGPKQPSKDWREGREMAVPTQPPSPCLLLQSLHGLCSITGSEKIGLDNDHPGPSEITGGILVL